MRLGADRLLANSSWQIGALKINASIWCLLQAGIYAELIDNFVFKAFVHGCQKLLILTSYNSLPVRGFAARIRRRELGFQLSLPMAFPVRSMFNSLYGVVDLQWFKRSKNT